MNNIFDLAEAAAKHGVQEIILPGWDNETITVRAKRPTLYNMASLGYIPNPLIDTIRTMFTAQKAHVDAIPLDKQAKSIQQMAKYALVEPTYEEIEAAGLTLTDEQLLCVYMYAIGGAERLDAFRALIRGGTGDGGEVVQDEAERAAQD